MSDAEGLFRTGRVARLSRGIGRTRQALDGAVRRQIRAPADMLRRPGGLRRLLLYASMPGLSVINAAVGLLLPKLLGPVEFGQYALVVTMFQYGLIFDVGLSQLLDRRLPVLLATGDDEGLRRFADEVLWVRVYVGILVLAGGSALMAWLAASGRLPFPLAPGVLSLAGGLLFMLALGPMAVWRATAQRTPFARWSMACSLVLAIGRPAGMVTAGLVGCFGLLAAGYGALAAILQAVNPLALRHRPGVWRAAGLLALGAPLFATSFIWAFYMTANRWVLSLLVGGAELGQFAFGANVVYLLVGTLAALAQLQYPAVVARAAAAPPFGVSHLVRRDLCWLALAVAVPVAAGIVVGPRLIDLFYPAFTGADGPVRALMAAVPSLVVASWLMPLSLSVASRPWLDGLVIYPAALALLASATVLGFRLGGIDGAGWGLVASSLPLLALQLVSLHLVRLLRRADALCLFAVTVGATAPAILLALLA